MIDELTDWLKLPKEVQKRLQLPRKQLTKAERKQKQDLFHSTGWMDAAGHVHRWKEKTQPMRGERDETGEMK